jgi:hypothetical protein
LRSISNVLPALPGFSPPPARAPWPVWRNSVAGPVRFAPMTRKEAASFWHKARAWDRTEHRPGRHGGIIGRTALAVFYALALDFQNFRTGRLDPSLDSIADKAGCCRRAVVDALARLRDLGMIAWQRRCEEDRDESGRFRLRQRTNAYAVLPPSQWRGYRSNDPPPPDPATLGAPERVPGPIEAAVAELTHGQRKASLTVLEADPGNTLALALASLGRAIDAREARQFTGVHKLPGNTTPESNPTGTNRFAAPQPAAGAPNPITEDEVEAEKARQLRILLGTGPPS